MSVSIYYLETACCLLTPISIANQKPSGFTLGYWQKIERRFPMETHDERPGAIVVGIALDPFFSSEDAKEHPRAAESRNLLKIAGVLSRTLGSPLHLVSVWETKLLDMARAFQRLPEVDWKDLKLEVLTQNIRNGIHESCREQLDKLFLEAEHDGDVTRRVVSAKYPAQGLLSEAETVRASLILLGAGTKADNFFTQGFSTVLTAMADARVPVLVVGPQCDRDFSKGGLRILLADDLRETTAQTMTTAAEWILKLNPSELLHLHVEELGLDRVRQVLGAATAELRSTVENDKLSADLMRALDVSLRERLQARLPDVRRMIEDRGGQLRTEVRRCAFVSDEIQRAADEFDADLIIFGRHQKVHQRPYMIGRVTYQAMLSQKRAVMVVP
jgi:nucleotide-binding universal stress UspA family protein